MLRRLLLFTIAFGWGTVCLAQAVADGGIPSQSGGSSSTSGSGGGGGGSAVASGDVPDYARGPRKGPGDGAAGPLGSYGLATPLPPLPQQVAVPPGGPLAAPIVLPGITPQGQLAYQMIVPAAPGEPGPAGIPLVEGIGTPGPRRPWAWASVDWLLGSTSGVDVPPLVTSGFTLAGPQAGAIGNPLSTFVFGERKMLDNWRTGVRAEAGLWLGERHIWGVSARYYSLFSTSDPLTVVGDGSNVVVVPLVVDTRQGGLDILQELLPTVFLNAAFPGTEIITSATALQLPFLVSFPGVSTGTAVASVRTSFVGGDANLRRVIGECESLRLEAFIGYRQLRLGDELRRNFVSTSLVTGAVAVGGDSVRSSNNFYGGQIGGLFSIVEEPWSWQITSAVAIGNNASDVDFARLRLLGVAGVALPLIFSDVGDRTNYFSLVSDTSVRLGLRVLPHTKLTFGYTALYWWNVRRAQNQYNLSQNLSNRTTGIFVSSFNWGIEWRY